jgi:hypothetical protein
VDKKSKRRQAEELMVGLADMKTMLAEHKGNRMCRVTRTTRGEKKRDRLSKWGYVGGCSLQGCSKRFYDKARD